MKITCNDVLLSPCPRTTAANMSMRRTRAAVVSDFLLARNWWKKLEAILWKSWGKNWGKSDENNRNTQRNWNELNFALILRCAALLHQSLYQIAPSFIAILNASTCIDLLTCQQPCALRMPMWWVVQHVWPMEVDIIISEWMGYFLFYESMLGASWYGASSYNFTPNSRGQTLFYSPETNGWYQMASSFRIKPLCTWLPSKTGISRFAMGHM